MVTSLLEIFPHNHRMSAFYLIIYHCVNYTEENLW